MKTEIKMKLIKAVQDFDGEFIWGVGSPIKPNLVTSKESHLGEGKPKLQVEALLCDIYLKEKGLDWEKHEWEHCGVKNHYWTCLNHSHGTPAEVFKWAGYSGWLDDKFYAISERSKDKIIEVINSL